ncbi:RluA family pseudouridine synthase [Vulgatibacter incomptus]|uniref:Pseudouridine synthase n=1 Tax=Vulgatibacter incomptus TaxID=1391653 RepID=A0A0K1PDL9_9BACT|nr:RluA family pseudouridine synthase [Vulgatibacter incomptus]AKU91506.1 Ribosomal large subunit pseudouridine synthase C [Vulgatibacter incomptus]
MFEQTISEDEAGQRIDKLARRLLAEVPLSGIFKMIRTKRIRVNGKRTQNDYLLQAGDVVEFRVVQPGPSGVPLPPKPRVHKLPEVPILYEDDSVLAVDKPGGMAVHPGSGIKGGTLVDWARHYLQVDEEQKEFKPSPAHRLDRETSGVILVAKKRKAMVRLTEIFTEGAAHKRYLALVKGRMPRPKGTIDLPLAEHQQTARSRAERGVNMQPAVTHFRVLASGAGVSLLECTIETGRTHQIRRHLAAIGHPVAGDSRYGDFPFNREVAKGWGLDRQFLHARRLELEHPVTGNPLVVQAPLPRELAQVLHAAGIAWTLPKDSDQGEKA